MNADARITLYGGLTIGALVTAVGLYCGCAAVLHTGFGFVAAALAVALTFEYAFADAA